MSAVSAAAFVVSIGRQMTDDRPAPQYGEYATPEQQAAAMGKLYVPPPAAETRVIVPGVPTPGAVSDEAGPQSLRLGGNLIDRFISIFQLGIGLVVLVETNYFDFSTYMNSYLSAAGVTEKVPVAVDHYGWLLLTGNIVFLLATFVGVFARLRRGKLAFYIPLIGYFAFCVFLWFVVALV
jgi:hypothetical protein